MTSHASPAVSGTVRGEVVRDPFDDDLNDDDLEPRDEYMDDEYCTECGRPSHAIMNGLCPMCFELTGGGGRID
jgi:hypothetical protein